MKEGGMLRILVVGVWLVGVAGVTQICNPGKSKAVYQFSVEACPYGVLFVVPLKAKCLRSSSDNDMSGFYADICHNVRYSPDSSKEIQFISRLTDGPLSELDSCMGNQTFQCDVTELREVNSTSLTEPGDDSVITDEENYDETEEIAAKRNDSSVLDQTFRAFQYLVGLVGDAGHFMSAGNEIDDKKEGKMIDGENANANRSLGMEEGPIMRITELLAMSFTITAKHCNTSYVSAKFGRDIRRLFLFILRESMSTALLEDVTVEEYKKIKTALTSCQEKDPVLHIKGPVCQTRAKAKFVKKNGTTIVYTPDPYGYVSYEHDVIVDATWGVTDFVHGLCYGTFREHINSHHLYQRAMERLFTQDISYRWERPPRLESEDLWNHMLSANTRQTMRNLDVCIQASYHDTPFVHRLERPLMKFDGVTTAPAAAAAEAPPARRKRDTESGEEKAKKKKRKHKKHRKQRKGKSHDSSAEFSLEQIGLSEAGWCFQTDVDQRKTVREYIETTCPDSPVRDEFAETGPASTMSYGSDEITPSTSAAPSSVSPLSSDATLSSDSLPKVTPEVTEAPPTDAPPDTEAPTEAPNAKSDAEADEDSR